MAGHHHHHHHVDPEAGDAKVFWAVFVNMALTVVQIVGGVLSGSLALIADALHNFSDAISLIIAFVARKIARRPANEDMTFGYGRAEVVAALVNYTTLIVIGLYLVYEAVMRFFQPEPIVGWMVVIIAAVALVVDLVTALLTYSLSKDSMNIRAAFLHNLADAMGSVAVILAGSLVILFDWWLVDPLVTLLIAGYILYMAFSEIGPAIRILMLGNAPGLDTQKVLSDIRAVPGVDSIHHVHLWQMQEHENALDAHIVITEGKWAQADAIKHAIKDRLASHFHIHHATLELECTHHACPEPQTIGHAAEDSPALKHTHHH
jgi:cobalt-zinc-cadmium efflux system protein